jgi:hypothetical protein
MDRLMEKLLPEYKAAGLVSDVIVSQFTREYGRMFGVSPVRDIKQARERMNVAA